MTSDYKNYALALFELAKEENKTDSFFEELTEIDKILSENKEYFKIFSSPAISEAQKTALIDEAFLGIEPTIKKFMMFIAQKSALSIFPAVKKGFAELYYEDKGVLIAHVTSAVSLSEEEKNKIIEKLSQKTGKKIELKLSVDKALIGGAVISYDGKCLDGSVKTKLSELKKCLI